MSNVIAHSEIKALKSSFLEMISIGYIETVALDQLNIGRGVFIRWCTEDTAFVKQMEEARRTRAEFWVSKIAHNIDILPDAKDVAAEKYRFEKLQFLARADNPDRYGNNSKSKVDISIDLKQFKLLAPNDAAKALANDPFAIEAEFSTPSGTNVEEYITIDPDGDLL